MENNNCLKSTECTNGCEQRYLACVSKTRTGCVEVLRVCREKCPCKG